MLKPTAAFEGNESAFQFVQSGWKRAKGRCSVAKSFPDLL